MAVLFALLIAAIRLVFAREVHFCGTPDACFYLATAKTLATEHRFHSRFLFDLQLAHPTLPNTGLEYWRPGTSLFLLLAKPFGVTLFSSIVVATLAGIALALAARHFALRIAPDSVWNQSRAVPAAAFCLCLVWPPLWDGSASPDSALFYGAAVAWFLALFTVRRQGLVQDLLALAAISAAYLVRNDAALLLLPLLAVLAGRYRLHRHGQGRSGGSPAAIALTLLGFFAALVPMHALYHAVLGTAFPGGTAQALFLDDLSDFVRYHDPVSLHTLLAHGAAHLLKARVGAAVLIVYRVGVLMLGYPALIFLAGLWINRREGFLAFRKSLPELTGPIVFAATLLLVYSLVLPAIGVFSALRSAVGLLPTAGVLTVVAIGRLSRTPRIAATLVAATLAAYTVSGIMDDRRELGPANDMLARDLALAGGLATLGANPATAVVMTADPVQFSVTTGFAAIAAPDNGLDAIAAECRDLGATHVMLDSEHLPAPPEALQRALQPVRTLRLDAEHALILELARPR